MESLVVSGIGFAALGYAGYRVWRNVNGKNTCSCGSTGGCQSKGGSCCSGHKK